MDRSGSSTDHVEYLTAYVLLEAADCGENGVRETVWDLRSSVLPRCRPFSSWPDERRMAITREVLIGMDTKGFATFHPDEPLRSSVQVTWEEISARRRGNVMTRSEILVMLEGELRRWWVGEHASRYTFELTDVGAAAADQITEGHLDELARRVGDYPRRGPLIILEREFEELEAMSPSEAREWEERRLDELTGLSSDEIRRWAEGREQELRLSGWRSLRKRFRFGRWGDAPTSSAPPREL